MNRMLKPFSNLKGLDDNNAATGRMTVGMVGTMIAISVILAIATVFRTFIIDFIKGDYERRKQDESSIVYHIPNEVLTNEKSLIEGYDYYL